MPFAQTSRSQLATSRVHTNLGKYGVRERLGDVWSPVSFTGEKGIGGGRGVKKELRDGDGKLFRSSRSFDITKSIYRL